MEPRYNEPLYNEVVENNERFFHTPVTVKYMKENLDITKPRYSEQILPVPWSFVISRFKGGGEATSDVRGLLPASE